MGLEDTHSLHQRHDECLRRLREQRGDNNLSHPAAKFCRSLSIGGYHACYLPATHEWDILWRSCKPDSTAAGAYPGDPSAHEVLAVGDQLSWMPTHRWIS
jgi:hypothetical protein